MRKEKVEVLMWLLLSLIVGFIYFLPETPATKAQQFIFGFSSGVLFSVGFYKHLVGFNYDRTK